MSDCNSAPTKGIVTRSVDALRGGRDRPAGGGHAHGRIEQTGTPDDLYKRPANRSSWASSGSVWRPLAGVFGRHPDELSFTGSAEATKDVWIAVRSMLRNLLEEVTMAEVASSALPEHVAALTADPRAWVKR